MYKQPERARRKWPLLEVVVGGEFACFTRPEMKVERVSYPVMTPAAARGILEAIFWSRDVNWQVREIVVLKPLRWFSIVRSESTVRQSAYKVLRYWRKRGGNQFLCQYRTLRHTLGLRDVEYLIRAEARSREGSLERTAAIRAQFRRRLDRGACFHQPYLGCREYAAYFRPATGAETPIEWTELLGPMFHDMEYPLDAKDVPIPRYFVAQIKEGVLGIPERATETHVAKCVSRVR